MVWCLLLEDICKQVVIDVDFRQQQQQQSIQPNGNCHPDIHANVNGQIARRTASAVMASLDDLH